MELDEKGQRLLAWFHGHGGSMHPNVALTQTAAGYRLSTRTEGIKPPAIAVTVPLHLTLCVLDMDRGGGDWPRQFLDRFWDSPEVLGRFLLMSEGLRVRDGKESFWREYLEALPPPPGPGGESSGSSDGEANGRGLHTPLWYTSDDWQFIEGTRLGAAAKAREKLWREEFETGMDVLRELSNSETAEAGSQEYDRCWYKVAPPLFKHF